jgi:CO/xanthine dehydrogenase FAD-binding subunit
LLRSKEDSKIVAGGQSLVSIMKLRLMSPKTLIDINGLSHLNYIREEDGTIAIGALSRHDQIANSSLVREKSPVLAEAASVIADQQVRNRGTIGGSLAHADPNADLPVAFLASNGTVIAASARGSRVVKCGDFFLDFFTTALMQDEIIQEVRIPIAGPNSGSAYMKLSRRHNDLALVSAAALVTLDKDQICRSVSVVLGGVAHVPRHAAATEEFLKGRRSDDGAIEQAAQQATEGLTPPSDVYGSSEYRLKMITALTKRVVKASLSRASGGAHR